MEQSANFIPLGRRRGGVNAADIDHESQALISSGSQKREDIWERPKIIGQTKEERKLIGREYRLAAKKEKKLEKADAKRARKLNGIMHRRATKNTEKYNKNKDRNKQRSIDLERQKIRADAVHQCERLAAKHDPTGKMFNVGEVVVTEDGQVRSKESIRESEARRAEREAEKSARVEAENSGEALLKRELSRKQQQRQEMYKPKPVPPRPVIPEGIGLPEGEENLLALWDITDQDIEKRLSDQKKQKSLAAKELRTVQKEAKKLNKAMKIKKKQCANAGVIWDPVKAKNDILKAVMAKKLGQNELSNSAADSSPDSNSSSSSESDSEADVEGEAGKVSKGESDKKKKTMPPLDINLDLLRKAEEIEKARAEKKKQARDRRRLERKQKQAAEEAKAAEEARAVAHSKAAEEAKHAEEKKNAARAEKTALKAEKKRKRSQDNEEEMKPQYDNMGKEDKSHKNKKTKTTDPKIVSTENGNEGKKKKKRKHQAEEHSQFDEVKKKLRLAESNHDELDREISKGAKLKTINDLHNGSERNSADQWNPDALTGDAARKDKFLRLLGAGKQDASKSLDTDAIKKEKGDKKEKKKDKKSIDEIGKVQADLERQYEAGMKMKHEGGGKRRGLGA